MRVLAELAGHRSIATTQRYIELNENVLRAAVELFNLNIRIPGRPLNEATSVPFLSKQGKAQTATLIAAGLLKGLFNPHQDNGPAPRPIL